MKTGQEKVANRLESKIEKFMNDSVKQKDELKDEMYIEVSKLTTIMRPLRNRSSTANTYAIAKATMHAMKTTAQ